MNGLKMQGYDIARDKIEMVPYGLNLLHLGGAKVKKALTAVQGEVELDTSQASL